jgi:hypothetical protein
MSGQFAVSPFFGYITRSYQKLCETLLTKKNLNKYLLGKKGCIRVNELNLQKSFL